MHDYLINDECLTICNEDLKFTLPLLVGDIHWNRTVNLEGKFKGLNLRLIFSYGEWSQTDIPKATFSMAWNSRSSTRLAFKMSTSLL